MADRQQALRGALSAAVRRCVEADPDITVGDVDAALRWMLEPWALHWVEDVHREAKASRFPALYVVDDPPYEAPDGP